MLVDVGSPTERAKLACVAVTATVTPWIQLVPHACVASVCFASDGFNQIRTAELLCQSPRLCLVDPHERSVQNEADFGAQINGDLQRFDRVVPAVRIAGVIGLTHACNDVLQATTVGMGRCEG